MMEFPSCCKNISAMVPNIGEPMATPLSGWYIWPRFSLSLHNLLTMHGHRNLNLANAQQAREIFQFKTLKQLLHKTTAAISFYKTCRENN